MTAIYSNGSGPDLVRNPFDRLASQSGALWLAAPYFTGADGLLAAAQAGKPIKLLVGLNPVTSPEALEKLRRFTNVQIRYLTHRFHAKVYIFDGGVLLGSSNLTDGGLMANREANVLLDPTDDAERVQAARALFAELWDGARVLTEDTLKAFQVERERLARLPDPDAEIERAVGRAEPPTINVNSRKVAKDRLFIETLRRLVYEQYRPAFDEVGTVLRDGGFRRPKLADIGLASETNRFLSWLRLTHVPGAEYAAAPLRTEAERAVEIAAYGREWAETTNTRVPADYFAALERVRRIFGSAQSIATAEKADVTSGLMSLHAFSEQLRFVKGGAPNLPTKFWNTNGNNVAKVKATLAPIFCTGPASSSSGFTMCSTMQNTSSTILPSFQPWNSTAP
jgi:hypothetical protein